MTLFEKNSKVDLLEKLPLSFQRGINIDLVLLIVLDELLLSEVEFLVLATKRIELIGGDRDVIDHSVILKLQLIVVFPELLDKTVNEDGQMG